MSSYTHLSSKYKNDALTAPAFHFRRKERKSKPNKIQRKLKLKYRHIILSFLFILGFFIVLQKTFVFLYSWERLDVQLIEIECDNSTIAGDIQDWFEGKFLGNLLLLDIDRIKADLTRHIWIKDVILRKSFPSTLKIFIKERIPRAVIKKEDYYLVDREGVLLTKISYNENPGLPLFTDSNNFTSFEEEKLDLGWKCLESLDQADLKSVEIVDLSKYENVSLKFKDSATWLILGDSDFQKKIKCYNEYRHLLQKYGPLEYANLSIDDRIIIKPALSSNNQYTADLSPNKEAM
jgi:cell division septal protein FtsQ